MNYRHAFHAGNHADVLKHAALLFCLDALKRKDAPFAVLDTHAGRGLYDLAASEAERSPEWRDGIARLWDWPSPPPLIARYLAALRSFNASGALRTYPGSPALITANLRAEDVLMACELHPEDAASLKRAMPRAANVQVHARDGWEAINALLPPRQKRGLVVIDPPYEDPGELERAAIALGGALRRFGHGMYLWWRPLKNEADLDAADAEALTQMHTRKETLRADLWVSAIAPNARLAGSSLFLVNPPFGLEAELREALPFLAEALTKGQGGWRLRAGPQTD
ncbi:MAG: 23S rRNA (adenine(2030)-N(6))-methyltransferase RlmJ [Hyphomonadaceae bacterium]